MWECICETALDNTSVKSPLCAKCHNSEITRMSASWLVLECEYETTDAVILVWECICESAVDNNSVKGTVVCQVLSQQWDYSNECILVWECEYETTDAVILVL